MRYALPVLVSLIQAAATMAVPVVDQSHVVTQSTGGRIIYAGNSPAQTFTVGTAGLLSRVEVLLQRDIGDIGALALELWPVVAGGPAGSTPLLSVPINPSTVPTSSAAYVPIDVTNGGLHVSPGEQFAIAVSGTAGLSEPNAAWTRGFPGYGAGGEFSRAGAWEFGSMNLDYGFKTWVEPGSVPGGLSTFPAQSFPSGDYNHDARGDAADYVVWRKTLGTSGDAPADGDGDGEVDLDDYGVWTRAFGTRPDGQVRNSGFEAGDLSNWNVVVEPNTDVSIGFPRVESFDVDGNGQANGAMRVRLGRLDTDEFGGAVAIEQQVLLDAGDYIFSADVASQSLHTAGNTGPGNYELTFDGKIVDQVMLNGTTINAFQVIRDSLQVTLTNVEAGYHTLRIAVTRGGTNTREIYQFIDDIQLNRIGPASGQGVPEPTAAAMLIAALGLFAGRQRQ